MRYSMMNIKLARLFTLAILPPALEIFSLQSKIENFSIVPRSVPL